MDTLTAIFGSQTKVKLLRLFLFNEQTSFFLKEIVDRTNCGRAAVKKELNALVRADLLKKKYITKEIEANRGNKKILKKIKGMAYIFNEKFSYKDPLKTLLTVASIQADESLAKRFNNIGKVKLIVASGVFIQNWESRVDLLLVGEELNLPKIESIIRVIESEIGKEIAYSAFETADFEYRLGIHDRLVRDILDYNHVTLLDRLGIEAQP
jgi:predicted transcriptional regulator